jgi:hypothetical protein
MDIIKEHVASIFRMRNIQARDHNEVGSKQSRVISQNIALFTGAFVFHKTLSENQSRRPIN